MSHCTCRHIISLSFSAFTHAGVRATANTGSCKDMLDTSFHYYASSLCYTPDGTPGTIRKQTIV